MIFLAREGGFWPLERDQKTQFREEPQNLSVIKNISEYLAGRVVIVELHGFTFQEIQRGVGGGLEEWVRGNTEAFSSGDFSGEPPPWHTRAVSRCQSYYFSVI